MMRLHYLNNSRAHRILWMLEELGLPYELVCYQRDAKTMLAPDSLKAVHPLGKSPLLTVNDKVLAESGAIIEHVAEHYGDGQLLPAPQDKDRYRFWLHFAEGSMMPPMLLKLVLDKVKVNARPFFVRIIAKKIAERVMNNFVSRNLKANLDFVEAHLAEHQWLAGDKLTGADIQMSFPLEASVARGLAGSYPHISAYVQRLHERPAYQRALAAAPDYDYA